MPETGGQRSVNIFVEARATIGKLPFGISAVVEQEIGSVFEARILDKGGISLSGFLSDFLEELPGTTEKISIPDVCLRRLQIRYFLNQKRFCFQAAVTGEIQEECIQIRNIAASLDIDCKNENGKNQISGVFRGQAEIFSVCAEINVAFDAAGSRIQVSLQEKTDDISLQRILDEVGIRGVVLPDALNPVLKGIKITYDTGSGRFYLESDFEQTKLFFDSSKYNGKREWIFGILLQTEAGFANIPVIGGSCDLLDEVKLKNMLAVVSSCDRGAVSVEGILDNKQINKGIYVATMLCLPSSEMELEFSEKSKAIKKAYLRDSNAQGLGTEIDIQKNIGPVSIEKIHFKMEDGAVFLGISAGLNLKAITFELMNLGVGYDLSKHKVLYALAGIGIKIQAGPLTAGGSFLRESESAYAGSILFSMGGFSLTAIGAYSQKEFTSFFVFGLFRGMIGGPPCFTVTGAALGFGYQRELQIPDIEELDKFPMLAAASGLCSQEDILQNEQKQFPPQKGNNWFAAGILFNSFRMVDAVGILTVGFGKSTEINLLGRAVLNIPFGETAAPIAHAVLILKAAFSEKDSLISVEAILSRESYILAKACRISGGFAFYTWYGGPHAGDFVLSLGGYHASYKKPAHYPDVRRLGLSWKISDSLSAEGDIYFALTPSCLMAGGGIKFLFTSSCVDAWLVARVDILLQWRPYWYDFAIGIQAGVRVHLWFIKFKLELGCNIHIWGPEFSGKVKVKLWCISFTVSFGANAREPDVVDADGFREAFLEKKQTGAAVNRSGILNETKAIITSGIQISKGVIREYGSEEKKSWIVCASELEIQFQTSVPANTILFDDNELAGEERIHIRPCHQDLYKSIWKLDIKRTDRADFERAQIIKTVMPEQQPAALWADKSFDGETIPHNTMVVLSIKKQEYAAKNYEPGSEEHISKAVFLALPPVLPEKIYEQSVGYHIFTEDSLGAAGRRAELLKGLENVYGVIELYDLNERAEQLYCECPVIVSLGGVSI